VHFPCQCSTIRTSCPSLTCSDSLRASHPLVQHCFSQFSGCARSFGMSRHRYLPMVLATTPAQSIETDSSTPASPGVASYLGRAPRRAHHPRSSPLTRNAVTSRSQRKSKSQRAVSDEVATPSELSCPGSSTFPSRQ
jgi:hypothetical protein